MESTATNVAGLLKSIVIVQTKMRLKVLGAQMRPLHRKTFKKSQGQMCEFDDVFKISIDRVDHIWHEYLGMRNSVRSG